MRIKALILLGCSLVVTSLWAQPYGDSLSVKVEATVNASAPSIDLNWPGDADASGFVIYRKAKGSTSWGSALVSLPGTATSYSDAAVTVNTLYDYKVQMTSSGTPAKFGYLSSGIEVKANSNRGIALVVVESSYLMSIPFQTALDQYLADLENDGWYPKTIYVNNSDAVTAVKTSITTAYNEDPAKTRLLVLIGDVPVPHSGDLNPDGHADHKGAWPTDTYYADINGNWTDATVNNTTAANALNHNIPGDGNFDQSFIPSDVELQVGRIDLSNLPAFAESEEELLLRYFDKAHAFKSAEIIVGEQALIDDNFTTYDEGFSQNGYNNFAALVGRSNTYLSDYFTQLSYTTGTTGTYLWSFGCGGGTYTSAGGIGSTTTFANDSLSSVFTMLFGSYFGDWDYSNAFLRAPLAQGNTLTNCWAGRPNWYFNHMAMGENIGYSTRLSQNNSNLYFPSTLGAGLARMVSINLMGDPSLRLHYLPSPVGLTIAENGTSNDLDWAAGGTEVGYNIYRRYADSVDFVKLNSSLVTGTSFSDNTLPVGGTVYYYVKAVEMKTTPSGSYENESLGARVSGLSLVGVSEEPLATLELYPNPAAEFIRITNTTDLTGQSWSVYNAAGQQVLSGTFTTGTAEIFVAGLPSGAYVFKTGSQEKQFIRP